MARHDDDLIEQTARQAGIGEDITAGLLHTVSQRVVELEAVTTALIAALTRYRIQHDMRLWQHHRPCRCEMCHDADDAISAAKGGA